MKKILYFIKIHFPKRLKCLLKRIICTNKVSFSKKRKEIFDNKRAEGMDTIPIFVISYNRLSYLKNFIECMEKRGKNDIIIIDNASTYQPLQEYYKTIEHEVIYMDDNYGHTVFNDLPQFDKYKNDFYIVTDPDVIPVDECPADFIDRFFDLLEKYPHIKKVGFSLRLDDIPSDSILGEDAKRLEEEANRIFCKRDDCFISSIDTTFALYPPKQLKSMQLIPYTYSGMRTAYPYQAKHLPWYKKANEITVEDIYYSQHKSRWIGAWDPANPRDYNAKC